MMKKLALCVVLPALLVVVQPVLAGCNPDMEITKPDNIYDDRGDGTVVDAETGLMWQKCLLGHSGASCESGKVKRMDWQEALQEAQKANAKGGMFGYNDWRLPSIAELQSLHDPACTLPALNANIFPNVGAPNNYFFVWSSTVARLSSSSFGAMLISFDYGSKSSQSKKSFGKGSGDYVTVRLVRGGL